MLATGSDRTNIRTRNARCGGSFRVDFAAKDGGSS